MAKKNSAVLWTVGQSLEKGDKEQARHNMGISFESSTTLTTKTLTFVDNIKENATTGDLTFTKNTVLVDGSVSSTSNNPVSGKAVSDKISGLNYNDTAVAKKFVTEVDETAGVISVTRRQPEISDVKDLQTALNDTLPYFVTLSTPFSDVEEAYTAGRLVILAITDVISANDPSLAIGNPSDTVFTNKTYYILSNTHQTDDTLDQIYFTLLPVNAKIKGYYGGTNVDHVYFTNYLETDFYYCDKSLGWTHFTSPNGTTGTKKDFGLLRFAGVDYVDYHAGIYMQTDDVNTDTGDALLITDKSSFGKIVRSQLAFNQSAADAHSMFLSKYGNWDPALPTYSETSQSSSIDWDNFTNTKFYAITNSPLAGTGNSPEAGNMFTLSGHIDRGSNNSYNVQLAMGDKLYYRHTTGTGSAWSDWITLNEYSAGIDLKLTGTEFAVNTTSTMDVYSKDRQCFTIGQNCETEHAGPSFIGGINSKLYGGSNSFIFGYGNIAGDTPTINQETNISSYKNFSSAFIVGSENRLYSSDYNFIWGTENTISSTTDVFNKNGYNIALGSSNMLGGGQHNIVIGVNNWLSQDNTTHIPSNVIMIGHDLQWKKSDGHDVAIFGRFNLKDDYRYNNGLAGTPLRITGCGLTDDNRANIEELYSSGMLWLKHAVETSCVVGDTTYANGIYIDYTNGSGGVNSTKSYSETATRSGVEFSRSFSHFTYMSPTSIGLSDVKEVKVISPEGAVAPETSRLHNVQFVSITHGSDDEYELVNGMPSRAVALEYKSAFLGSSGISLGEPKMPAWNTNIASNCETSWLTIFGNRTYAPSSLPWDDSQTKPGNLKLGKLAIKYFLDTDLQVDTTQHINNAIIPGEQVGELTFIVGTSNYGFWIHDDYYTDSTPTATYIPDPGGIGSTHLESRYIRQNTFCILMTTKPTVWNKNVNPPVITQFGEFKALVSSNF